MQLLEKIIKKILLKINEFNKKQWFVVSLLTTTSGIWFSLVLNFWGDNLGLTFNENGKVKFTVVGIILTIATISWSFLSVMAQRYNEYHNCNLGIDMNLVSKTETIYETIEDSITSINEKNVSEKILYVDKIKKENGVFPQIYVKPCVELNEIIVQMREVLSKLLTTRKHNLKTKDLVVNIYYCFSKLDNVWHRANSGKQQKGLATRELINSNTSFSKCLASDDNYVYYHDKKEAYNKRCYVPDELDGKEGELHYLEGSILCKRFSVVCNDDNYIDIVIAISTYGKKFSKYNDEETQNNISYNLKNNILNEYEPLIKDALCDLYIQQEYEKQQRNNTP